MLQAGRHDGRAKRRIRNLKALVTGGAGFIGSHIVERLVHEGHEVKVFDDLSTGFARNLAPVAGNYEFIKGDLRDAEALKRAVHGVEAVFHEAALGSVARSVERPELSNAVNADGTLALLMTAREAGVRRFVYASSSSVYGETPTLPKREDMQATPASPYGVSKLAAELYCRVFASLYGLETVSLRYFNVFGPRQDPASAYAAVIPRFTSSLLREEKPVIFGDGGQTRDFTYVENVVEANMLALKATRGFGQAMNVAAGNRVSVNELVKKLQVATGSTMEPEHRAARHGDIRDSYASIEKAGDLLGYRPVVTFDEGLRRTVEWFCKHRP
jgi:UDP-glucose 4-epimerase